jgi:hypothetical protein
MAGLGEVRCANVRPGGVWRRMAWFYDIIAKHGRARLGIAWPSLVGQCPAGYGSAWLGLVENIQKNWHGKAGCGIVWFGPVRSGKAL